MARATKCRRKRDPCKVLSSIERKRSGEKKLINPDGNDDGIRSKSRGYEVSQILQSDKF